MHKTFLVKLGREIRHDRMRPCCYIDTFKIVKLKVEPYSKNIKIDFWSKRISCEINMNL